MRIVDGSRTAKVIVGGRSSYQQTECGGFAHVFVERPVTAGVTKCQCGKRIANEIVEQCHKDEPIKRLK